jgi:hypothetical protein
MAEMTHRAASASRKYYPHARFPKERDPSEMPEVYASVATGSCLEPVFKDGTCFAFSKVEAPRAGDYVSVWFDPDIVPTGEAPRSVKRLVDDLMPGLTFPYRASPGSQVVPLVRVEMLNPPRRFAIPADKIIALHTVIGTAISNDSGKARLVPLAAPQMEAHHD